MTLETQRARAEVERTREQLSRSMLALRGAMVRRAEWREWVRRRPVLFFAAALTLGFVFGHGLRWRQVRGTG